MTEPGPPPTVFEFAPDIPEGVEVFSDPNCVKITVAPPTGRKQRLYIKAAFALRMVFICCWGVGFTYMGWANPSPVAKIFLLLGPIATIAFATVWLKILRRELGRPTVFSIKDVKSFRVAAPGEFEEKTWPLHEHDKLILGSNDITLRGRRGGLRLLRGYPPATREWVVREFKRAGRWAYDWLTFRVTLAAAEQRGRFEPQYVTPAHTPATATFEAPSRITSFGFGPKVLDFPIPPPRGNLRYQTIPNGVAITAPPPQLSGCGITLRVVLVAFIGAAVLSIPNRWVQIGLAALVCAILLRSILKYRWRLKQPEILAVLPGEFVLEDVGWAGLRRQTMQYDKARALTAYLCRPEYNYVGIEGINGDLFFGHRCNEDEIRWLAKFIQWRADIPEAKMKITRPGQMQHHDI